MKKIILIAIICLMAACKQEQPPKDYAVLYGKITNPTEDTPLRLYNPISSESILIKVAENGTFRDTLKLEKPTYFNAVYNNLFSLFLANGMDVELNFDGENISETVSFAGKGGDENKFLQYKTAKSRKLMGEDYKEYLGMEPEAFAARTHSYSQDLLTYLEEGQTNLDSTFVALEKENIAQFEKDIQAQHEEQLKINSELSRGMESPQFTDYINYKGGTKSLSDFKGKYTYIDVWATWCVPCIYEMPFMKEVEEEYSGRNINFVGISIDRKKDEDKWRKMIEEKNLGGIQLLADNEIESEFIKGYYIQGIPRFILLDPDGKIISYDAPRPSEPNLKELFDSLDI